MAHTFPELVIGGVLFAPFVTYLIAALTIIIILRPILHVIGFATSARRAEEDLPWSILSYWTPTSGNTILRVRLRWVFIWEWVTQ